MGLRWSFRAFHHIPAADNTHGVVDADDVAFGAASMREHGGAGFGLAALCAGTVDVHEAVITGPAALRVCAEWTWTSWAEIVRAVRTERRPPARA